MEVKHVIQMIQHIHDGEMDDVAKHVNQLYFLIQDVIVNIMDSYIIHFFSDHNGYIQQIIYVQFEQ